MRESVIYQEILQEGRVEGRDEGRVEEGRALVLRLLTRKLGNLTPELTTRVNSLTIDRVESLGEALLDFQKLDELIAWLENNS